MDDQALCPTFNEEANSFGTDVLIQAPEPKKTALLCVSQLGFEITHEQVDQINLHVDCKTYGCRTVHVPMHLGEKGKAPQKVEYWMSYPLRIDRPAYGKTYDYSDAEEAFWQ
jgi:hypothetical protein